MRVSNQALDLDSAEKSIYLKLPVIFRPVVLVILVIHWIFLGGNRTKFHGNNDTFLLVLFN
jgi:hypothetical protein